MKESTRLYCHECDGNFTIELDMGLNGNHEIRCPKCGHIHYRVVENGKVTDDRYRSSMQTYTYTATITSSGWTAATAAAYTPYTQLWTSSATYTTGTW